MEIKEINEVVDIWWAEICSSRLGYNDIFYTLDDNDIRKLKYALLEKGGKKK